VDEHYPLTYAQESFLTADVSAINVPAVVPLAGEVRLSQVRAVLDAVAARHGALRTTIVRTADGPHQRVRADGELRLDRFWHDGTPAGGLAAVLLAGSERPFVLEDGRLARAELHIWGQEHVLIVWMHHSISDLVTGQVLGDELGRHWLGETLAPPAGQLAEYAQYERGLTPTTDQWAFWTKTLAGLDDELGVGYPGDTPHLMVRPALPRLDPSVVAALGRLATGGRTTLTAVLAAAVIACHAPAATADRVLIGLTMSNRDKPRWQTTIGCLADQLPLAVDISGGLTFRQLLGRVRDSLLDAYEHRLPLGVLLPLLPRQKSPVFAVNLNFLPPPARRLRTAQPEVDPRQELPYGIAKSRPDPWWLGDASLAYRPRIDRDVLAGEVEGDGHLHDAVAVAGYGERFCTVLGAVADDPDRRIHTLVACSSPRHPTHPEAMP
jgi:Condensation domain